MKGSLTGKRFNVSCWNKATDFCQVPISDTISLHGQSTLWVFALKKNSKLRLLLRSIDADTFLSLALYILFWLVLTFKSGTFGFR